MMYKDVRGSQPNIIISKELWQGLIQQIQLGVDKEIAKTMEHTCGVCSINVLPDNCDDCGAIGNEQCKNNCPNKSNQ